MVWVATAVIGSTIINGVVSSNAAKKASKAQVAATNAASQTARDTFDKQTALAEPFRQADLARQAALMQRLGVGGDNGSGNYGDLASGFMPENYMTMMDPGYDFRFSEGMKALDRRLSASGMNASGAGLKAATRYGQDYASGEYQNAFNRYQTSRNATLNPLMGNSGMTNNLINAAGTMGAQVGENQLGAGNAQAAGYIGGANAWNQAISSGVNAFTNWNMFNNMYGAPGTTAPGGSTNAAGTWQTNPATGGYGTAGSGRGALGGGLTGSFSRLPGG